MRGKDAVVQPDIVHLTVEVHGVVGRITIPPVADHHLRGRAEVILRTQTRFGTIEFPIHIELAVPVVVHGDDIVPCPRYRLEARCIDDAVIIVLAIIVAAKTLVLGTPVYPPDAWQVIPERKTRCEPRG